MRLKFLLFILFSTCVVFAVEARSPHRRSARPVVTNRKTQTNLLADRGSFKKEIEMRRLAAMRVKAEKERESLLYPADELYGDNWDTKWVNPFHSGKVNVPDSCSIDMSQFTYPLDGARDVTSPFGPRHRRMHEGVDLDLHKGDTVRAAFDGRIRIENFERGGYGYYIVIRHPNGLETVYGHLSKFIAKENDIVHAGDAIGLGGSTGHATGPHLHFETRFLGQPLNPANLVDFENCVPIWDTYVFHKGNYRYRRSSYGTNPNNIYASSNNQIVIHRVKKGDTLGAIARRYHVSVAAICSLNGIKRNSMLHLGQALRCSKGGVASSKRLKLEREDSSIQMADASVQEDNDNEVMEEVSAKGVYHRIKSGDTLGSIAEKYGTSISKLCQLNNIKRTTTLRLGRSLRCS